MNVPKLSPLQWFRLVAGLLPYIRGLVKATGMSVVAVIRMLIDLIAKVEDLFPAELNPDGTPKKRGSEKASALADLIAAGFVTADERIGQAAGRVDDVAAVASEAISAASVIVGLFNEWSVFATNSGVKPHA